MESILFVAGIFAGISIAILVFRAYFVGCLRIDTSDQEEGPYLFLELNKDVGDISSKKYVILKVSLKNFISHK